MPKYKQPAKLIPELQQALDALHLKYRDFVADDEPCPKQSDLLAIVKEWASMSDKERLAWHIAAELENLRTDIGPCPPCIAAILAHSTDRIHALFHKKWL